jgi:hypothetical protein
LSGLKRNVFLGGGVVGEVGDIWGGNVVFDVLGSRGLVVVEGFNGLFVVAGPFSFGGDVWNVLLSFGFIGEV